MRHSALHLQLVPDRNLAFEFLTNHTDGWHLIQDVERATLRSYEGLALKPNQPIGHRGVNEAMNAHATPLTKQPGPEAYVGSYRRPPVGTVEVREQDGKLVVSNQTGGETSNTTIVFYGPDVAYAIAGSYTGMPMGFVRNHSGTVGWIRINGGSRKRPIFSRQLRELRDGIR